MNRLSNLRVALGAAALFCCATFLATAPVAQAELVLRYDFDEDSGDALDSGAAPAADGTLMDGATRSTNTPGGFGNAIDFTNDDPNALVLGSDAAKLEGLSQITVSTWVNVAAFPGDAGPGVTNSGNKRLASKQDPGGGGFSFNMNSAVNDGTAGADDFKLAMFVSDAGGAGFTWDTSTADVDAGSISAADHWVFLAATYDSTSATDNLQFYIGDVDTPVSLLGDPITLGQTSIGTNGGRFGVGFTDAAASGFDFSVDGLQDDVRIYDTALSLGELDAVRLQNAVPEPSSVALLLAAAASLAWRARR